MHDVFPIQRSRAHALGHYHPNPPGRSCSTQPNPAATAGDFPALSISHRARLGCGAESAPESSLDFVSELGTRNAEIIPPIAANPSKGSRALKTFTLALIRFYQVCLSPSIPSSCRFYPSCSGYAYEAVSKWGVRKGATMALERLLRCRPFGGGGYDPVP